jgi:hypothetical protein
VPLDAALFLPAKNGVRGEFGAVVADQHRGVAADFGDAVEFPCHPQAGERGVNHQAQAFAGEVVNQGEDAEAPPVDERVGDEVERERFTGERTLPKTGGT